MCFNCCHFTGSIPESTSDTIVIQPITGTTECFCGVYNAYDEEFPERLIGYISRTDFDLHMSNLNDTLQAYWPCCTCFNFGYLFCPCTLGLSLIGPMQCVDTAQERLQHELNILNEKFKDKDIRWVFIRKNMVSWIEIHLPARVQADQRGNDLGNQPLLG